MLIKLRMNYSLNGESILIATVGIIFLTRSNSENKYNLENAVKQKKQSMPHTLPSV